MRNNHLKIRHKLLVAFLASAAAAGVCMFIIFALLIKASVYMPFAVFFMKHIIIFSLLLFAILVLIMSACFFLLSNNQIKYLEEITQTLAVIADGDLKVNIPVKSEDELGKLAAAVNSMAGKLMLLIEAEKSWEKTKNDLITNVSHDLRTPLTSMLGYLDLIANLKYKDEESLQYYASIALAKCNELKDLIDDLFEYSKLMNKELKPTMIAVNLGELIEQAVLGFIPMLKEAQMEYRLNITDKKISINADPLLLARVFENLINNAINYGREGKYLDVELQKDNNAGIIRIINYGNVISNVDLPLIFDRFYQQKDNFNCRKTHGSGLGLAIVKSIVQMHGGTVTASSSNSKTVFEIRLKIDDIPG